MEYHLAIDIGASSGRLILSHMEGGRMVLEEIHRFPNGLLSVGGHSVWDLDGLWREIEKGLIKAGRLGKAPKSVGVDTWGVDYVLLDAEGRLLSPAYAYRDGRNEGMRERTEERISSSELYGRTGIQHLAFNTVYQLEAQKVTDPGSLEKAEHFLMIPDWICWKMTGRFVNEYTDASTTSLLDPVKRDWDRELIERLGFPSKPFGRIGMPGEDLGPFKPELATKTGYKARVVLVASHDTGSAFMAVPAESDRSVFISSGTWSLLGVENREPVLTEKAMAAGFTNEGGYGGTVRFLRNIMGLWLLQEIRRELSGESYIEGRTSRNSTGRTWTFPEMAEEAERHEGYTGRIDVDDGRFLAPESMIDAVKAGIRENGGPEPESIGDVLQAVYMSLALSYRESIRELGEITGRKYESVNIVGGGSRDDYLDRLIARVTGLRVLAGPTEGTSIGNITAQAIADGTIRNLEDARKCIRRSFDIREVRA